MLQMIFKWLRRMVYIMIFLCVISYLLIVYFYKGVFVVNTWINGVYCTGKTVEEVNTELLLQTKAPFLTIQNADGEQEQINLAEVAYREDFTTSLENHMKNQSTWKWPLRLLSQKNIELLPEQSWDENALKRKVQELDIVIREIPQKLDVRIEKTSEGYVFHDNLYHVLQPQKLSEYANSMLKNGELIVQISLSGAYEDVEPTEEQKFVREQWVKLQEFLECGIVYDMGAEQIPLDKKITSEFVLTYPSGQFQLDENGEFCVNESGIERFIDNLAFEYDTCDGQLAFAATRGETVMVDYVTYGTKLDAEAEKKYLLNAFQQDIQETHIPAYIQEGYVRGKNDIGDTYIEVDMGNQKLYAYKAGELIVETDIVTGNMRRKWNTPEGVNFVYFKQKKRTLRGPGYATPVDYWMPVKGAIGLHDADWRKEFGGDIYLKNGSHGCVNIPPEVMPTIYEEYEVGTPVIMFY